MSRRNLRGLSVLDESFGESQANNKTGAAQEFSSMAPPDFGIHQACMDRACSCGEDVVGL